MKSLRELWLAGIEYLEERKIEEARLDAWYLLEMACDIDKTSYLCDPNQGVTDMQEVRYQEFLTKRAAHIPLQYITGEQEFMGYPFYVDRNVLIPRQDTEILVEEASKYICDDMEVLDMCTGSGCIIISLSRLHHLKRAVGADISKNALEIAKKNEMRNHVSIEWIEGNMFENMNGGFDCIVSNPPYIPTCVIETLSREVKEQEPRSALDGKEDGLYFYRILAAEAKNYLKKSGRLFLEIGHDQGKAVTSLLIEHGFLDVQIKKDLAGLDRVCIGTKPRLAES